MDWNQNHAQEVDRPVLKEAESCLCRPKLAIPDVRRQRNRNLSFPSYGKASVPLPLSHQQ